MSVRVSVQQLQEELPQLLEQAVQSGQEYIVQRDGKDYAVIVSARQWQQRKERHEAAAPAGEAADEEEGRAREVGRRLDALGPEYRLPPEKQERMEELLARRETASLAPAEQRELERLIAQCDEIMLRRARALSRVL